MRKELNSADISAAMKKAVTEKRQTQRCLYWVRDTPYACFANAYCEARKTADEVGAAIPIRAIGYPMDNAMRIAVVVQPTREALLPWR